MLQKTELKTAVSYARAIRAELEEAMREGACIHGHFDYSLDMEYACLACEHGDDVSLAHVAYRRAIGQVKRERASLFLEFIKREVEREQSDTYTMAKIEMWVNAYKA